MRKSLWNVRSYADEPRTEELRRDAINEMVELLKKGVLTEFSMLQGKDLCDMLACCFAFGSDEKNRFMANVVDDAIIIYSNQADKDVQQLRNQLVSGLLRSTPNKQSLSGVQCAIRFFRGDTNAFHKAA